MRSGRSEKGFRHPARASIHPYDVTTGKSNIEMGMPVQYSVQLCKLIFRKCVRKVSKE